MVWSHAVDHLTPYAGQGGGFHPGMLEELIGKLSNSTQASRFVCT